MDSAKFIPNSPRSSDRGPGTAQTLTSLAKQTLFELYSDASFLFVNFALLQTCTLQNNGREGWWYQLFK